MSYMTALLDMSSRRIVSIGSASPAPQGSGNAKLMNFMRCQEKLVSPNGILEDKLI
jgi:hypothetical protein